MRYLIAIFFLIFLTDAAKAQKIKIEDPVHYLALGDSYTIGQNVDILQRWPNQLADKLTSMGYNVADVKFIAQTGWRTDNLKNAIEQQQPLTGFNLVSLLIGVNNQYQGGSTSTYYSEFTDLLKTALALASNKPEHVFVLSIPDYAYTPYGAGNSTISNEIDQFNSINKIISESYKVNYVDITPISRLGLQHPDLVASDGLHPSGIMYTQWVQEIMKRIENDLDVPELKTNNTGFSYTLIEKQLMLFSEKQSGSVFVYNANGQVVQTSRVSANSGATINLNGKATGLYIILVENDGKILFKAKFVVA
jgi:lysophospholipase L1-like esterase